MHGCVDNLSARRKSRTSAQGSVVPSAVHKGGTTRSYQSPTAPSTPSGTSASHAQQHVRQFVQQMLANDNLDAAWVDVLMPLIEQVSTQLPCSASKIRASDVEEAQFSSCINRNIEIADNATADLTVHLARSRNISDVLRQWGHYSCTSTVVTQSRTEKRVSEISWPQQI